MKEYYYMKDLMEYYGLSRDSIKYYEEKELIKSTRDKNGYRKFDRLMFKKLGFLCMMHSLGISLDDIKCMFSDMGMQKSGKCIYETKLKEIEEQEKMLQMQRKLLINTTQLSESYEEYYHNIHRYDRFFTCLASSQEKCRQDKLCWRREVTAIEVDEEGQILSEKEYEKVVADALIVDEEICRKCSSKKITQGATVRCVIKLYEMDKLQKVIRKMYQWGAQNNYQLQKNVYCCSGYYREPIEEGIALDLYIPILNLDANEKKEEND